jgi:hypothetical protein
MSNGPFIGKDDRAVLEKLSITVPRFGCRTSPSAGRKNGSTSLPTLKLNGASHVALPSIVRLVKGIGRKSD